MKSTCQQCKGNGGHFIKLKQSRSTPYKFAPNDGCMIEAYVSCNFPGCHNGTVDHEENYKITQEISK